MKSFNVELKMRCVVKVDVDDDFSLDESETKEKLSHLLYDKGADVSGVDENDKYFNIGEIHEMEIDSIGDVEAIKE